MKKRLQHWLNPLHLWCLCGGQGRWCIRMYEKWFWRPVSRSLITGKQKVRLDGLSDSPPMLTE